MPIQACGQVLALHLVIQEIMGWENRHLHRFRFGNREYGIPDPEYPSGMRNERGRRLREFLRDEGQVFEYQYDFSDNWKHDVVVEKVLAGADVTDARCLEGERACPPEDVGDPDGYMDYLEAMRDPPHPDPEQMVEWRSVPEVTGRSVVGIRKLDYTYCRHMLIDADYM